MTRSAGHPATGALQCVSDRRTTTKRGAMPNPNDPALETDRLVSRYAEVLGWCVTRMNADLDDNCSIEYKDQPLAQDWARIAKVAEELGEAIAELILWTGQNPRKQREGAAGDRMLDELCDVALTALYAIQHFTCDSNVTTIALVRRSIYHCQRRGMTVVY